MVRSLSRLLIILAVFAGSGVVAYIWWQNHSADARIAKLEQEKKILNEVIGRLTAERRVAELLVTDEKMEGAEKVRTVLFVEYGRDGKPLPPRSFTVRGEFVHVDAMVVKFDTQFVKEGDPLRGSSIAFFTKLYGDKTAPSAGLNIDTPNDIPDIYRGQDPKVTDFEKGLWKDFWTLAYDEAAAKERGVRTVLCQGVNEPVRKNFLYTLSLEANGGLTLKREPLKDIYRQALEQAATRQITSSHP